MEFFDCPSHIYTASPRKNLKWHGLLDTRGRAQKAVKKPLMECETAFWPWLAYYELDFYNALPHRLAKNSFTKDNKISRKVHQIDKTSNGRRSGMKHGFFPSFYNKRTHSGTIKMTWRPKGKPGIAMLLKMLGVCCLFIKDYTNKGMIYGDALYCLCDPKIQPREEEKHPVKTFTWKSLSNSQVTRIRWKFQMNRNLNFENRSMTILVPLHTIGLIPEHLAI